MENHMDEGDIEWSAEVLEAIGTDEQSTEEWSAEVLEAVVPVTARQVARARAFPELRSLVRGLVFAWTGDDGAPELQAARRWIDAHCRACGAARNGERGDYCRPCRVAFRSPRRGRRLDRG
jgi:hypothetical protein